MDCKSLFKKFNSLILSILLLFVIFPNLTRASELVHDYIFLIDVSGSMVGIGDGHNNNVFPYLKTATKNFVSHKIPAGSVLRILTFGEKVFANKEFRVNKGNLTKIFAYIDNLKAIGKKTDLYGTTADALKIAGLTHDKPVMLLIFTDGKDNVGRVSAAEVLSKYKFYKSNNPNLYVLCQYFTFSGARQSSPFPAGVATTRLNRDDDNFLKNLQNSLAQLDQKINEGLAKVKAEQEKLKQQAAALAEKQRNIAAKLKELQESKKSLTEAQKEQMASYQRRQKELKEKEDRLRKQQKAQAASLLKQRERIEQNLNELSQSREALRGQQTILTEADNLLARSRTIADFMRARSQYESILDADRHNARAALGIKKCDRQIDRLTPAYQKKINWFYALLLAAVLFLINRLVYLGILPNPLALFRTKPMTCILTYQNNGEKNSSKIILREKNSSANIGSSYGKIIIPCPEAVVEKNHFIIRRRKNKIYLVPSRGIVLDYTNQTITAEKEIASYSSSFNLQREAGSEEKSLPRIEMTVKIA